MKPDPRIIQIKSAGEACSKRTFERWEKEKDEEIKKMTQRVYGENISPLHFIIKSGGDVRFTPKKWWEFWK